MQNIRSSSLQPSERLLISEVLDLYGIDPEWQGERGKGGMNNSTFVIHAAGASYILRQYETHNDQTKIAFEHGVLMALARAGFELETPLPVHRSMNGQETYLPVWNEKTGTTKIVSLFHYLQGANPLWHEADQLRGLGLAAGVLSSAMANLKVSLDPAYPPYYRIQDAYPLCSPAFLLELCISPPEKLAACGDELKWLQHELPHLFKSLQGMEDLPHQLVHGDLNASNVLADEQGDVRAILDFEFATWDLRVMELAVPMSDLLTIDQSEAWMWEAQAGLIQGFREHVQLLPEEIEAIPQLILLRSLDVVMHFISRMLEGTDEPQVAVEQIVKLQQRMKWMKLNESRLRQLLSES